MDMVYIIGQTEVSLKVIGKRIKLQDLVFITGKMEEYMRDIGNKIICMVKGYINGLMVASTKEVI
jgi:hypothetical protein